MLSSRARHHAPTVILPLHPREQIGGVPETKKMGRGGGGGVNPAVNQHIIQGRVEILFVPSCYRNWYEL